LPLKTMENNTSRCYPAWWCRQKKSVHLEEGLGEMIDQQSARPCRRGGDRTIAARANKAWWGRLGLKAALLLALLMISDCRALAQDATKIVRIGVLASAEEHPIQVFKERLRELGWMEGRNVRFDYRWAEADDTGQPALAAELVALPADLILTWGTAAALAAKRATATIPIVMGSVGDPVKAGIVSSLARPGGNVTGFSSQSLELEGKRLELMRELIPGLARVVMLGNTPNTYIDLAMDSVERLATAAGLKFDGVKVDSANGLSPGLDLVRKAHPDAVLVAAATAFFPYRKTIAEFMADNRLPAIYGFPEFAEAGGLIAYSTNFDDIFRRAAGYVDKILRGASPGELPVQQATVFKLLINLSATRALGLTIPRAILGRADEVIE
jgi:putative ABC transport system substrate-binding protein